MWRNPWICKFFYFLSASPCLHFHPGLPYSKDRHSCSMTNHMHPVQSYSWLILIDQNGRNFRNGWPTNIECNYGLIRKIASFSRKIASPDQISPRDVYVIGMRTQHNATYLSWNKNLIANPSRSYCETTLAYGKVLELSYVWLQRASARPMVTTKWLR
jgi:hypothetical protein